jgi:capsular exopolysaccharide synthesis family protein
MGFFYQALKKATGVATDPQDDKDVAIDSRSAHGVAQTVAIGDLSGESKAHRRFDVRHPIESLVAFLSPPIEDENIVAMEHVRVLRTRIWEILKTKNLKSLLMTSAMPAEGKTLLSVNLAFALSQIENVKVLLVDVDMRRPSVGRFVGLLPEKGLNTYLTGADAFDDVVWELSESLDLVPTMPVDDNSAELLHGKQMVQFLAEAKSRYDVILMDGPPLFPIVDAQVLAPLVDAAILVVRAGKTPYDLSRQAAELLRAKFIGSILNGSEMNKKSGYYGGYYNRYGGKPTKKKN